LAFAINSTGMMLLDPDTKPAIRGVDGCNGFQWPENGFVW
jgi:hypothetical protein